MPKKKTEEENNLTDSIYEPDMAPLAKKKTDENESVPVPDSSEKTGVFVKLVNGGSFPSRAVAPPSKRLRCPCEMFSVDMGCTLDTLLV